MRSKFATRPRAMPSIKPHHGCVCLASHCCTLIAAGIHWLLFSYPQFWELPTMNKANSTCLLFICFSLSVSVLAISSQHTSRDLEGMGKCGSYLARYALGFFHSVVRLANEKPLFTALQLIPILIPCILIFRAWKKQHKVTTEISGSTGLGKEDHLAVFSNHQLMSVQMHLVPILAC